ARSTSGSHSSQAVIERRDQSSATSASDAAARSGMAPSECEMRCTQLSSDGNSLRQASRSSVVAMVPSPLEHGPRPVGEELVAHVPERREEPLLHAALEELRGLALERRRARPDDAVDEHEMALPPGLQQLVEIDERLGDQVALDVPIVMLVEVAHRQAAP